MPGYFQPVEIKAPSGALISLAIGGRFDQPQAAPVVAGMLIAPVYRLRVTAIPANEGYEVYPTIEVIDRLYPPVGQEHRFPIVVELTQEDLQLALAGKFVTRVIYLEHPIDALPVPEDAVGQRWFEAEIGEDPLQVADTLGRPVAILRMGGRVPDRGDEPGAAFLYNSPPWLKFMPRRRAAAPLNADQAVLFDARPRLTAGEFIRR